MNKQDVLDQLELMTISEAETFSFLTAPSGSRFAVVKQSDGDGVTETLQDIMDDLDGLSKADQQDIYDSFNTTSQVMGGRPCK